MKFLRKINKGFILTVIVILLLSIYLVNLEKQREADKAEIKTACEKFIHVTNKYLVLPEEMQTLTEEISEDMVKEYKQEAKNALKDIMVDNEEAINIQHQFLEQALTQGYHGEDGIRSRYERNIVKINSFEFDGDRVTVTFNSKVITESKYLNDGNEEQTTSSSFSPASEEIMLQKVDGEWKVVYANLQYTTYGNSMDLIVY